MFHEDSFDSRSFDEQSWLLGILQSIAKPLKQTFVTAVFAYTFITQQIDETTVTKRG